jgi:hypothetical protein
MHDKGSSRCIFRMPSSGVLCHVDLVRADISEECITSIIRVTRMCELGTLAVTSNRSMLRGNETSVLTTAISNLTQLMYFYEQF